ncbi:TPA: hypothetical protein PI094_000489 [Staphylococcus aureus]|nr:hypothetical protein [Staphylococcus aureus]HDH4597087.1 hypothetical protein [Staphylococcus aureus]
MWVREITKNNSTAYRYLERYTDPLTGKYKTVSVTRNKNNVRSQKDAQLELNKIIEQRLKHNSTKQLENLTFHDACDEWLEHYKTHSGSKPTTIKEKKSNANTVKAAIEHRNSIMHGIKIEEYNSIIQTLFDEIAKLSNVYKSLNKQ